MSGKVTSEAAGQVVVRLVDAGLIDPARSAAAEKVVADALVAEEGRLAGTSGRALPARPGGARTLLVEIAGYAGGALVVASLGLFLARQWNHLSGAAQTFTLLVVTLALVAAGLLVSRAGGGHGELRDGRDEVRRRLASALLTAGAVAGGLTVGQRISAMQESFSDWPTVAGAFTILVLGAAAYAYVPSALTQLALAGSAFVTVVTGWTLLDADQSSTVGPGLTLLVLGVAWLVGTEAGVFDERTVARCLGAALTLFGAQLPAFDGHHGAVAYTLLAAAAVAGFVVYLRSVAWPYLIAGVAAITLVVPEAVIDWTEGSLGVAGGVLVAGLTLLGASLAGLRARREADDAPREQDPSPSLR